jgi:hypothetical protein
MLIDYSYSRMYTFIINIFREKNDFVTKFFRRHRCVYDIHEYN